MGSRVTRILVVCRDQDDFRGHIYDRAREVEYQEFAPIDWVIVTQHGKLGSIPVDSVDMVHVTADARHGHDYHEILRAIGKVSTPPPLREWRHDVPTSLMPSDIEEWLAQ